MRGGESEKGREGEKVRGWECGKGFLRTRDGGWGFGKGFLVVWKRLFEGVEWAF